MKVSVIIPAYNAEPYIAQAIESCLQQTAPPDEIIVADDSSTDGTAAIAKKSSKFVKVVQLTENSGVSVARNRAIEESTADWIAFLDADDYFLPDKLELQADCIRENPHAVLIYSGFRIVAGNGLPEDGSFSPAGDLAWRLRYQNPILTSSVLLRREAFDAAGGFDPVYRSAQDWDMWLRIAERFSTAAFAAVPNPLVMYRRVPGSLSSSAMRYFNVRQPIIENRSLYRTSGIRRLHLRRRIHAFNHFDTSLALREERSTGDLGMVLKSLALWPFPGRMLPMKRYTTALVMLMQHLGWWPNLFRPSHAASKTPREHKG